MNFNSEIHQKEVVTHFTILKGVLAVNHDESKAIKNFYIPALNDGQWPH